MVLHKDESVENYSALAQVVRQLREKSLAVVIAAKDVRAAIAAAGDMVQCVGKINAWWTWHASTLSSFPLLCKT